MKFLSVFLFFSLILSTTTMATVVEEDPLEAQTRDIAKTLRCAVCQSESVWESNAKLAKQMRQIIRERLEAGESPEEIRTYFLGRYGDYILLEPRKDGFNWLIWAGPFLLLGVGGLSLFVTLSRWVRRSSLDEPEEITPITELERSRIEKESKVDEP